MSLSNKQVLVFSIILVIGIAIRIIGLNWGLSSGIYANDLPFHPDELTTFNQSYQLYSNPDQITFTWGGAFYYRTAFLIRELFTPRSMPLAEQVHSVILNLRAMNIFYSIISYLCLFILTSQLYGVQTSMLAASLFIFFPNHVMSSHFARPDVLFCMLVILSLLFSVNIVRTGKIYQIFLAALFAGLSVATLSWGVVNFVPITAAIYENHLRKISKISVRDILLFLGVLILGGVTGYLFGSFESLLYPDIFLQGLHRASAMHGGQFGFPWMKLGPISFFAFGLAATLLGYIGFFLLLKRNLPGWMPLASFFIAGAFVHGFQDGRMMRYVLMFAPFFAITGALALHSLTEKIPRKFALTLWALVIIFTLQISSGYATSMQFSKDIRYVTGDWLVDYIRKKDPGKQIRVGVTQSFFGDLTYQPSFPVTDEIIIEPLMLRPPFDTLRYLEYNLDYLVISDFAVNSAKGSAPLFLHEIIQGDRYRRIRTFGPPLLPFTFAGLFRLKKPDDLLYTRLSFDIYEKIPRPPE